MATRSEFRENRLGIDKLNNYATGQNYLANYSYCLSSHSYSLDLRHTSSTNPLLYPFSLKLAEWPFYFGALFPFQLRFQKNNVAEAKSCRRIRSIYYNCFYFCYLCVVQGLFLIHVRLVDVEFLRYQRYESGFFPSPMVPNAKVFKDLLDVENVSFGFKTTTAWYFTKSIFVEEMSSKNYGLHVELHTSEPVIKW